MSSVQEMFGFQSKPVCSEGLRTYDLSLTPGIGRVTGKKGIGWQGFWTQGFWTLVVVRQLTGLLSRSVRKEIITHSFPLVEQEGQGLAGRAGIPGAWALLRTF